MAALDRAGAVVYNPHTMSKAITAVFFDMGSTLSYQEPTREVLLVGFLHQQGFERSPQDLRRALLAADTWWHEWTQQNPFGWRDEKLRVSMRLQYRQVFLAALGLDASPELRAALDDAWSGSIMRRHNAIFPDVMPTLHAMRAQGLRLAIVSNWDESLLSHTDELGLTPLFETIVGSLAVGYEKPHKRIFEIALERLALAPEDVIHVGDMYVSDVVGARRAGIRPVLLDRYDLMPQADCLRISTLDQLLPLVA
jgi:putative hydrolase of the HAD superfamily